MSKMYPSFREEDQHMAENLGPVVIGPPAYASPDPKTNEGRLVPVDQHPFDLDKDYGGNAPKSVSLSTSPNAIPSDTAADDAPEDREEWTKDHWLARADALGVEVNKSDKKADVRTAVEDAEDDKSY